MAGSIFIYIVIVVHNALLYIINVLFLLSDEFIKLNSMLFIVVILFFYYLLLLLNYHHIKLVVVGKFI